MKKQLIMMSLVVLAGGNLYAVGGKSKQIAELRRQLDEKQHELDEQKLKLNQQLSTAVGNEQVEAIQALLGADADANYQKNAYGNLLFAMLGNPVSEKKEMIACLLLDSGANPETTSRSGRTALYMASSLNMRFAVEKLLEKGANPLMCVKKVSPLHKAAQYGSLEAARILMPRTPANVQDELERTPLHYAAGAMFLQTIGGTYSREMVGALLEHGEDPDAVDRAGKKPRGYADPKLIKESAGIIELLDEWSSKKK